MSVPRLMRRLVARGREIAQVTLQRNVLTLG